MYPYNIKKSDLSASEARTTSQNSNQTLADMLIDAIHDEVSDFNKYIALSRNVTDKEDSEIVRAMAYDEYKHRRIFEEIYKSLMGSSPDIPAQEYPSNSKNLVESFTDSLFDELEAVELYREIMSAFENLDIRDMVFEIITDEQAHADILNYLIAKYRK